MQGKMAKTIISTRVIRLNPDRPDANAILEGANTIRSGRLVAFPTETVYGLGANALDAAAVAQIFKAKSRPAGNPLIVHVIGEEEARELVLHWPDKARELANRFWPGPLTLVLPGKPGVIPDIVTAGGTTVAMRSPAHAVARALLLECGLPIAAPSANRSTRVSPTSAEHVLSTLDGRIDLILDAGRTPGGIESTVLNLAVDPPCLLRPGIVTTHQIEEVVGAIDRSETRSGSASAVSPGMMERHYSPRAKLVLSESTGMRLVHKLLGHGFTVGWIPMAGVQQHWYSHTHYFRPLPTKPNEYASELYSTLHDLDDLGVDYIVVQIPPDTEAWAAVRDRLKRAASS
jgi:L-threonylcarbamoyladenylate synthase